MIGLFPIIVHYGTIIRYYCAYYCTYYCTYYGTWVPIIRYYCTYYSLLFSPIIRYYYSLFFLLFSIMAWCRHPKNGNVQTAILDPIMEEWLVSVEEECLLNCIDWKVNSFQSSTLSYHFVLHFSCQYSLFTGILVLLCQLGLQFGDDIIICNLLPHCLRQSRHQLLLLGERRCWK